MSDGYKTSEFHFGVLVMCMIFALIWWGKFPEHGTAGYEGVQDMMIIWGAYTGYRGFLKKTSLPESGNGVDVVSSSSQSTVTTTKGNDEPKPDTAAAPPTV